MTAFKLTLAIILICLFICCLSFYVGQELEAVGGFFAVVGIVFLMILPACSTKN